MLSASDITATGSQVSTQRWGLLVRARWPRCIPCKTPARLETTPSRDNVVPSSNVSVEYEVLRTTECSPSGKLVDDEAAAQQAALYRRPLSLNLDARPWAHPWMAPWLPVSTPHALPRAAPHRWDREWVVEWLEERKGAACVRSSDAMRCDATRVVFLASCFKTRAQMLQCTKYAACWKFSVSAAIIVSTVPGPWHNARVSIAPSRPHYPQRAPY
ncbi:hypothetical protein G7046_g1633 [Stylonectria norvegica]|nr:hypothetical protein G7046_g1633 [Stylonectria norvegica]